MKRLESRRKPKELTAAQKALLELRRKLNLNQPEFAQQCRVGVVSIRRWETVTEPRGWHLFLLSAFALSIDEPDIARVFQHALWRERPYLREWQEAKRA